MIKLRKRLCRAFITLLAVLLLIPITALGAVIHASAETSELPKVTVEDKTVHRGQTFEVEIRLDKNPGLTSMLLELNYNKDVMELVGVKEGDALGFTFTTTNHGTEDGYLIDPFRLLWDSREQSKKTGLLATLVFESEITAPTGEYPVELSVVSARSEYGVPTELNIDNGIITLIKGEYSVIYKNWDGTVLYEKDYNENEVPTYIGETPTRPTDSKYSYEFKGWRGEVSDDPKVIIKVADYNKTPETYQVTFIVDGEYFHGDLYDYGATVDLSYVPSKQNHNFSGWFLDEEYTQPVTYQQMTDHDLTLYGYMKYNVREEDIPQITLSVSKIENGIAYVNVDVTRNTALSGLVLTLDYDRTALEFIGFERGGAFADLQFDYTNTENGYDVDPFKFFWESATNTYETGTIVTLKFKMDETKPAGLYGVTVTYDETTDATFFTEAQELWYTQLEIIGASVPIGNIHHWYENTEDGIGIDVTTEEGQSPETVLEVKKVTYRVSVSSESILAAAGEHMELKDVYSVRLLLDGVEAKPNGIITVKIELTEAQSKCKTLLIFYLEEDGTLTAYPSVVENGMIVFETEHLSNWALIGESLDCECDPTDPPSDDPSSDDPPSGDTTNPPSGDTPKPPSSGDTPQEPADTPVLIIAPILLAITTMGFALVLMARSIKKKKAFNYTKNE